MYTSPASLTLGFHGCDREVGEKLLSGSLPHLSRSDNDYDWLGHGIYFWENNPLRAQSFAEEQARRPRPGKGAISKPFVVGAIVDVGHCLNLVESNSLSLLRDAYQLLCETSEKIGASLPQNLADRASGDLLRRNLDCAVIETLHTSITDSGMTEYDTVRGVFMEGPELYPNSGFREKNHIQICVRNTLCIKGYFRLL